MRNVILAAYTFIFMVTIMALNSQSKNHEIKVMKVTAELNATRASDIRYYNDCLQTSTEMSHIKSCISVHGH